jgi:hypothetical protein
MVWVFVSFDIEHDEDLFDLLSRDARGCGFSVKARSQRVSAVDVWSERVRRRMREVDLMIVLCGGQTDASTSVAIELSIAREEHTPYFLVWGRREIMCTKPLGARPTEGMYGWTREVLRDQVAITARRGDSAAMIRTGGGKHR